MTGNALVSPCGTYRYWLLRTWAPAGPVACFVMLNPSTADAATDDPTIRRCVGFAEEWGCGGIAVVNLFALRARHPEALGAHPSPIGQANDAHVLRTARQCGPVVAAWGTRGGLMGRDAAVAGLLRGAGVPLVTLGLTKDGHPKRPLYVKAWTRLVPFAAATEGGAA